MKKWMTTGMALAAAALMLTAVSCGPKSRVKKGQVMDVLDQDSTRRTFIEAIGIGGSDPGLPTQTQRRALARDAAIIKAHNELLAMIKGAELESGQTVEQSLMANQVMTEKLKHTIKGAEIVKTEFTNDDGAVVTMRLPKKRIEKLMGVKFK